MLNLEQEHFAQYEIERKAALARDADGDIRAFGPHAKRCLGGLELTVSPAVERFADRIFERFDAWSVVSVQDAAAATGLSPATVIQYMDVLRQVRSWPYRTPRWKAELVELGRLGPFVRSQEPAPAPNPGRSNRTSRLAAEADVRVANFKVDLEAAFEAGSLVTAEDASRVTGVPRNTAYKYIRRLRVRGGWVFESPPSRRRDLEDAFAARCIQ